MNSFKNIIPIILFQLLCYADNAQDIFIKAAIERTTHKVVYNGNYFSIPYPNGDIPDSIGVCTDVVIRSYRKLNIDLQKLVHEDMKENFNLYPSKRIWGLKKTDRNIDHRRVPNLQIFFSRFGTSLPITNNPNNYKPGDLVTWMLPGNLPHIGIVSNSKGKNTDNFLIIHNIGSGPNMEDILFQYPITGHYRYFPE